MRPEILRQAGLDALRRELGATGMVRFLQQIEGGSGDYTAERSQWVNGSVSVEELAGEINRTTGGKEDPSVGADLPATEKH